MIVGNSLFCQTSLNGDLVLYVDEFVSQIPGRETNVYTDADSLDMVYWQYAWENLFHGKYLSADSIFQIIDYEIILFTDTIAYNDYILVQKIDTSTHHWGLYAWNPLPCRSNVILQAPHPRNDSNTGDQAAYVFRHSQAQALMVAGTHRCNSLTYSPCSGTTQVCGDSPEPYRNSDLAHTVTSIFQSTTELFYTTIADPFFVQLHGFSKQASDPYLIMSNGSRAQPTTVDYLSLLADSLEQIDSVLTFKIAHIDTSWTRLIGFTNTQGRLINGSTDFCFQNAVSNSGRFLHLEQERSRLRADAAGWHKLAIAIEQIFRQLRIEGGTITQLVLAAPDSITLDKVHFRSQDSFYLQSATHRLKPGFSSDSAAMIHLDIKGL